MRESGEERERDKCRKREERRKTELTLKYIQCGILLQQEDDDFEPERNPDIVRSDVSTDFDDSLPDIDHARKLKTMFEEKGKEKPAEKPKSKPRRFTVSSSLFYLFCFLQVCSITEFDRS